MEDFVTIIKAKTGLPDEQAKAAVQAIMDQLKKKFPQILHSELDKVAAGGEFGDSLRQKMEGMKDKLEDAAKHLGEKAEGLAGELKVKLSEMFGPKKDVNPPPKS